MNKKLQEIIEIYDNEKISLEELIYHLHNYERERFKVKTKRLVKKLHPELQKMFWDFIKEIEDKNNFLYSEFIMDLKIKI